MKPSKIFQISQLENSHNAEMKIKVVDIILAFLRKEIKKQEKILSKWNGDGSIEGQYNDMHATYLISYFSDVEKYLTLIKKELDETIKNI